MYNMSELGKVAALEHLGFRTKTAAPAVMQKVPGLLSRMFRRAPAAEPDIFTAMAQKAQSSAPASRTGGFFRKAKPQYDQFEVPAAPPMPMTGGANAPKSQPGWSQQPLQSPVDAVPPSPMTGMPHTDVRPPTAAPAAAPAEVAAAMAPDQGSEALRKDMMARSEAALAEKAKTPGGGMLSNIPWKYKALGAAGLGVGGYALMSGSGSPQPQQMQPYYGPGTPQMPY